MRGTMLGLGSCGRGGRFVLGAALVWGTFFGTARGQPTSDQMADQILTSARRAYNERNYPVAAERFREFLKSHAGHKDAPHARYGLGLVLMESPQRDFTAAIEALRPVTEIQDYADRPVAQYYLGAAQRGLGNQALALAISKPAEAPQHRNTAAQQYGQAVNQFAAAAAGFAARVKQPPAAEGPLPADLEWSLRARCEQAEMLLRTDKPKEAAALVEPVLSDVVLKRSRYVPTARFYFGYAQYTLKDHQAAGRALSLLAPFDDPALGVHARYLLARTHQLSEERAEAAAHYESLLAQFDQQKKVAAATLKDANALKNEPEERARLDALVNAPPPDYVARAWFYWGVLLYEQGKFAESLDRFAKFAQQYPNSPLIQEAQLRQGLCQVQLKQFAEAPKALTLLADHAQLGDQARGWLAKAQVGAADPNNAPAYAQALTAAIDNFRKAADKAGTLAAAEPDAKLRRSDFLLSLADTQQLAKQFKEAAATYQLVVTENAEPLRVEQASQRLTTAYHLAGQYKESDDACQKFQQTYPKSSLLGAVLFRQAENAFAVAEAAAANPALPNRADQLKQLCGEAIKRYQKVIDQFPEFAYIGLARFGLAMSHYRLGQFEEAAANLAKIPDAERTGDLAAVPYVLADCVIRTAPTDASDALAAGRLLQQMTQATTLLSGFLASQAASPQAPDAMLKLGNCQQSIAGLMAEPQEQNKVLAAARQTYEKLIQQFATHALQPVAVFERAKCMARSGDVNGAVNELNRFQADPLKNAPVAPLALLRLSSLLRAQNKPAEAAVVLEKCRAQFEAPLQNDAERAAWIPLIQYQHGLALKESGKLPEAQAIFDNVVAKFAGRPEAADAAWRGGQCRKDLAQAKLDAARTAASKPGAKPEEVAAATKAVDEAWTQLRETAKYFEAQAPVVAQKGAGTEPHLRLLYEAAWCQRLVGDEEIQVALRKLKEESLKKLQEAAAKATPAGQPVPIVNAPDIAAAATPVQPAEQKAREHYTALVNASPEAPLALVARFELAEMHAARNEQDAAIKQLTQALQLEPAADLAEQIQLRLGSCYLAKNDPKAAAEQFAAVSQSPQKELAADARYRLAEASMLLKDYSAAIQQLTPFRDQEPLRNIAGVSDRALLRLGHAYAHAAQWDPSRQALEALLSRYPQSAWRDEARYGVGWAMQNQGQFDNAVGAYAQVIKNTAAEVAARSQLQVGVCRLSQKRYAEAANALLVVPFTYDYPDCSALALCEASRAFIELKQPLDAGNLLKRVVKDHPTTRWAEVAKQRLAEIKE